jgi:sulfoxide reductase catalytic subunit YedY
MEVWLQKRQIHRAHKIHQQSTSQPLNTRRQANSNEYGFYSNVNPNVDHPRWSQAKGRCLKRSEAPDPNVQWLRSGIIASLYSGVDLKKNF